jgi:hypothetical protein
MKDIEKPKMLAISRSKSKSNESRVAIDNRQLTKKLTKQSKRPSYGI